MRRARERRERFTYVDLDREKQPGISKYAQIKRTCLCTEKTAYVVCTGQCVSLQVLHVPPSSSSSSSSCIAACFNSTRDSSSSRAYPIPAQTPACERTTTLSSTSSSQSKPMFPPPPTPPTASDSINANIIPLPLPPFFPQSAPRSLAPFPISSMLIHCAGNDDD